MKKTANRKNKQTTTIPNATLKAIKQALFKKGGIDLSPIVRDLAVTRNEEIVGIQVGLMMMGFSQEVDKERKYTYETSNNEYYPKMKIMEYNYIATGVIDGVVKVSRSCVFLENGSKCQNAMETEEVINILIEDWESETFLTWDELNQYPEVKAISALFKHSKSEEDGKSNEPTQIS